MPLQQTTRGANDLSNAFCHGNSSSNAAERSVDCQQPEAARSRLMGARWAHNDFSASKKKPKNCRNLLILKWWADRGKSGHWKVTIKQKLS
jgi:hypothetical protein